MFEFTIHCVSTIPAKYVVTFVECQFAVLINGLIIVDIRADLEPKLSVFIGCSENN